MNSKLKELKNAYKTATENLEYAYHSYESAHELAYDTANYSLVRDAYNTYINARNAYEAFINLKE
ncbi:hypothetical protein [Bathymodiolus japonicus methanotrophic gill symbiont]|uniref:hypothetical protein n=1 Tax=Bathymodiolus japonicus methanotrophic gill symbiont TaxID=113269 RepID=UPI001C8D317F|nr:hypothetical protein [Bathymodiolus japonicus methanotrophic gill symbiont]